MKKPYNYVVAGNVSAVFCGEKQMSVPEIVDSLNDLLDAVETCASVVGGHELSKSALARALEKSLVVIHRARGAA